jgi:two-component system sensor histidine kinase UhpB
VYNEDKSLVAEALANVGNISPDNSIHTGQARVILADGEVRWVEWTTRVIFDADGTVIECQSVGRDITPIKQVQETMEQQNELLRQLGDQLINIQENERQRIARDLHDSVLNELGAMLISAPDVLTPKVVRDNYQKLIEQLRQTINGLRTPMLNYGLHAALEDLFDRFMDNPQNEFILTMDIPPNLARYDTNVELHLFRIIQQACDNAVQHARAHNIRIRGRIEEDWVDITVEDDGIGFLLDPDPDLAHVLAQKHFGLVSMLERGQIIDANVTLSSQPGIGTQVRVYWASKED